MKTLKVFALLLIILGFKLDYAIAQDKRDQGEFTWPFDSKYYGPSLKACLGEDVSGEVIAQWFESNNPKYSTYHEKGHGVLHGQSNYEYTLDYEYNSQYVMPEEIGLKGGFTFPMLIRREGKIKAVVHYSGRRLTLWFKDDRTVDHFTYEVECK
jgi:hypothetical protein